MKKLEKLKLRDLGKSMSVLGPGQINRLRGGDYLLPEVVITAYRNSNSSILWGLESFLQWYNYSAGSGIWNSYGFESIFGSSFPSYGGTGGGGGDLSGYLLEYSRTNSVQLARDLVGNLQEIPGDENNPGIMELFSNHTNFAAANDEDAWCAAFVSSILEHSGRFSIRSAWVLDWAENWGRQTGVPNVGDLAIRADGHHIGIISRIENGVVYMISGNDGGNVTEVQLTEGTYNYYTDLP